MSCGNPHETPCSELLDAVYTYLDGEMDQVHGTFDASTPGGSTTIGYLPGSTRCATLSAGCQLT